MTGGTNTGTGEAAGVIARTTCRLENGATYAVPVLVVAAVAGLSRGVMEGFASTRLPLHASTVVHYVIWYLLLLCSLATVIKYLVSLSFAGAMRTAMLGMIFGILPPALDLFFYGVDGFSYAYVTTLDPWFRLGSQKTGYIGELVAIWLGIGASGVYIAIRTRSFWKGLSAAGMVYCILMVIGGVVPLLVTKLSGLTLLYGEHTRPAQFTTLATGVFSLSGMGLLSCFSEVNRDPGTRSNLWVFGIAALVAVSAGFLVAGAFNAASCVLALFGFLLLLGWCSLPVANEPSLEMQQVRILYAAFFLGPGIAWAAVWPVPGIGFSVFTVGIIFVRWFGFDIANWRTRIVLFSLAAVLGVLGNVGIQ